MTDIIHKFDPTRKKIRKKTQIKNNNVRLKTTISESENSDNEIHSYMYLLDRFYSRMGSSSIYDQIKIVHTIPQLSRAPKKTVWINFQQTAKIMNRNPNHLLDFTLSELCATGTYDSDKRLTIKGRYTPTNIDTIQKKYISEYITCKTCGENDTILKKEARLYFILCQKCSSTFPVPPIKTGILIKKKEK